MLRNYVDNAEKPGVGEQLSRAMGSLEYIFKFIVRSRVLFNQYVPLLLPASSPPWPPSFYTFLLSGFLEVKAAKGWGGSHHSIACNPVSLSESYVWALC